MKDWFTQLDARQRILVMSAAALFVVAVIFIFGIRPVLSSAERNQQLIADKESLLVELTQAAERLGPQTRDTQSGNRNQSSLVVLVDQTTRNHGLSGNLKRNQPDGANSIRLRLENAPFDALVPWLSELQNSHGLSAASANIDTAQSPGRVNCNLVLSRVSG